jgi:hypothetical protein
VDLDSTPHYAKKKKKKKWLCYGVGRQKITNVVKEKGKDIPVTGRGGP